MTSVVGPVFGESDKVGPAQNTGTGGADPRDSVGTVLPSPQVPAVPHSLLVHAWSPLGNLFDPVCL